MLSCKLIEEAPSGRGELKREQFPTGGNGSVPEAHEL
jgi:hypothetical protein